jgi:hypothetical protein
MEEKNKFLEGLKIFRKDMVDLNEQQTNNYNLIYEAGHTLVLTFHIINEKMKKDEGAYRPFPLPESDFSIKPP